MRAISPRDRRRAGLAMSVALGLGLGFPAASPAPASAARVDSKPKLTPASSQSESSVSTQLALLAHDVAEIRSSALAKTGSKTALPPVPTSVPQSGSLIPTDITDPITNAKLLKDFEHLIALKSGKLVNWNQATVQALESDLGISSATHVAPHLPSTKPVLAAQTVGDAPGGGPGTNVQPAAVPEPSTLFIFALAMGGLAVKTRIKRK